MNLDSDYLLKKICSSICTESYMSISSSDMNMLSNLDHKTVYNSSLCIFIKSINFRTFKNIINKNFFGSFYYYALVPSRSDIRWIIPINNRMVSSKSLKLYNPQSLKGIVFKYIASLLSSLGIQFIWGSDRLIIISKSHLQNASLISLAKNLFSVDDVYLAFSTGTPGYYRKITAQIMSSKGKILAYAKIATTKQAQLMLIHEYKILCLLSKLNLQTGNIPNVIYIGKLDDNFILIQSPPSVKAKNGLKKIHKTHINFLSEIFNLTITRKPFLESDYWLKTKGDVENFQNYIDNNFKNQLQSGINICQSILKDKVIPFGLAHRDFVPWNTYFVKNRIFVFDWEYADEQCIPFWDIIHFTFFPPMLKMNNNVKQFLKYWHDYELRQFIYDYSHNISVDVNLFPVFFLLYLINIVCFYLHIFIHDGLQNQQREWLLKTWTEMLYDLTTNWKEYFNQWISKRD